jgi:hypothetical protein
MIWKGNDITGNKREHHTKGSFLVYDTVFCAALQSQN